MGRSESRRLDSAVPPSRITATELDDLMRGALLLGCGGGGDARTGELLAAASLAHGAVDLLPVDVAQRQRLTTMPVGVVGASGGVFDERLPTGTEFHQVVEGMQRLIGATVSAVLPIEAGGLNGPLGVWASASLRLPLVDADLCGRAVPRIDQMTAGYGGRAMTPAVCVDPDGRQVDIGHLGTPYDGERLERAVRSHLTAGAGWLAVGFRPLDGEELADCVVAGAVSRCVELGSALGPPKRSLESANPRWADVGAEMLATGRVLNWRRAGMGAHDDVGWVSVQSGSDLVRIDVQNEILAVAVNGRVVAATPDVLALLDSGSGQVLDLDSVRHGARIDVIRIQALYPREREEYLRRVGPPGFGLEPAEPL